MIRSVVHALIIVSLTLSLVGCQSGPRWAWWKKPSSLLASKDEAPALPSASAAPQAVAATGLEPAASPSATNLAAAGGTASATSLPADLTAPLSTPNTGTSMPMGDNVVAAAPPTAAVASPPSTPAPPVLGNVPAAGPYDPAGYPGAGGGYQGMAAVASTASSSEPPAAMGADRYAMAAAPAASPVVGVDPYSTPTTAAIPSAPTAQDQYASNPAPVAATPPSEPLGQNLPSLPPSISATGEVSGQTPVPVSELAAAATAVPQAPSPLTPGPNVAPQAVSTSAAGQYRPGGTSSFPGLGGGSPIEVAARPSPFAPASSSSPATTPAAAPWAPPTTTPGTTGSGTRTY